MTTFNKRKEFYKLCVTGGSANAFRRLKPNTLQLKSHCLECGPRTQHIVNWKMSTRERFKSELAHSSVKTVKKYSPTSVATAIFSLILWVLLRKVLCCLVLLIFLHTVTPLCSPSGELGSRNTLLQPQVSEYSGCYFRSCKQIHEKTS